MKKNSKKLNKDFWLWFGGALLILILIISFLAIPYANNNSVPPTLTETTETTETPEPTQTPTPTPEPEPTPTPTQTYTKPSTNSSCYHEEAGRCWDDLEDEAYSAGQYDRLYGYYGATLEYADDCNALCREIIEDAYDEGWYDF